MSEEYYKDLLAAFCSVIAKEHIINIKAVTRGDASRFITHVQNVKHENYPDLNNINTKALLYCKTELERILLKAVDEMPENCDSFQLNL